MSWKIKSSLKKLTGLWRDCCGQDMIEYGMLAAFMATVISAFVPYQVIPAVSNIYSRINNLCSTLVPW